MAKKEIKLLTSEERQALIDKPFPTLNIVKTSYAGASRGLTYYNVPASGREQILGSHSSGASIK